VVAILVSAVLVGGAVLTWQAYRQRRDIERSMGSMMDSSMGTMHGPDPLWYGIGTLLVAGSIGGVYYVVRGELTESASADSTEQIDPDRAPTAVPPSMGEEASRSPRRW
jgi:hypothetical protein